MMSLAMAAEAPAVLDWLAANLRRLVAAANQESRRSRRLRSSRAKARIAAPLSGVTATPARKRASATSNKRRSCAGRKTACSIKTKTKA